MKIILRASLLFLKFAGAMSRAPWRFLIVLAALSVSKLFAEPFFLPREDFWATDGLVLTVVETNGVVYLGGQFSYVSPSRGSGVSIDIASGTPNRAFPEVNGTVFAVAPDGSGGWFIGGPFTAVGGVPREGIAHIRQDNTVDTNWNANLPAGLIYTIAVSGQNVFVGGGFNYIGGQPRENLAALNAAHGEATDWTADANDYVMTLAVSGNTIYAGGDFTQVGGQSRSRLAAVDTRTGQITPWNPNADGEVDALSIVPCDRVYIGGKFTTLDGQARNGLAAVDVVSGRAIAWNPNPTFASSPGQVSAIAVSGQTVFVGGFYTRIGGQPRNSLAAVDSSSGAALPWNPGPFGLVMSLAISGDTVYAGGNFSSIGGTSRNDIAAIDLLTGQVKPWNPQASGWVFALGISENSVYVGGEVSAGGTARHNLAAFDAATGQLTDWNPDANEVVSALAFAGGKIYAAGTFTEIGGQSRNYIAALDSATGQASEWDPNADASVSTLVVTSNTIYLGGSFSKIGSEARANLAALDLDTGKPTPWNPSADGSVETLALDGNTLYAGGNFTNISGRPRHFLAGLDTVTGNPTDWNPNPDAAVRSMARFRNTLYIGGDFGAIAGMPRHFVGAVDLLTGQPTAWNPSPNTNVFVVAVTGEKIYLGGGFTSIDGEPRFGLADFDRVTGSLGDWSPPFLGPVYTLAASTNRLYVGGFFSHVGEAYRPNFAAFPPDGSPVIARQPRSQFLLPGETARFEVNAFGDPPLSYQWQLDGTNLPGANNSALTITNVAPNGGGPYTVVVRNPIGFVQSADAVLTVFAPVAITSQTGDQTISIGSTLSLNVTATGSPPPTFQWRLNGVNIPSATGSSFTLTNAQPADGGSYEVVVGNIGGAVKSELVIVTVASPALPFADLFAGRLGTNSVSGLGSGNNTNSATEPGEPKPAGKTGGKSLWYSWRAPATGVATFHTRGSDFDTLLAIYTGNSFLNLIEVVSDDDRGGFLTSQAAFNAVAGTDYLIALDGFAGASGNIVLSWNLDTAAPELPRIINQPLSQTVPPGVDVTFSALVSSRTPVSYQWFYDCAPIPFATDTAVTVSNVSPALVGTYTVRVRDNSSNIVDSLPAFLEIGPDPKARSQDKFQDLFPETEGAPALQSPPNPRPEGFPSVSAGTLGTQNLNNFNATTELGEPLHGGFSGGASRWFKVTAADSGVFQIDTLGSDIDTVLAVYTGNKLATLNLVASDNNSAPDGIRSLVKFPAKKTTSYLIAVDGIFGAQGRIQLNWKLGIAPAFTQTPSNFNALAGGTVVLFASATAVPAPRFQWLRDGLELFGETNSTLTLRNIQETNQATYKVVASNFAGSVSTSAMISVIPRPRLNGALNSNGRFSLAHFGQSARSYVIQGSTNLIEWTPLFTNGPSSGTFTFTDLPNPSLPYRFYRSFLLP